MGLFDHHEHDEHRHEVVTDRQLLIALYERQGTIMAQIDDLTAALAQTATDLTAAVARVEAAIAAAGTPVDLTAVIASVNALDTEIKALATTVTPPPPVAAVSNMNPITGADGTPVTVDASGYAPNTALTVTVGGVSATVTSGTTDSTGSATVNFTIPSTLAPGAADVVVSDGTGTATLTAGFTVA